MSGPLGSQHLMYSAGAAGFYDYQIEHSCRFDSGDTSYLYHDRGTPTNNDIVTISAWIKRGKIASEYNSTHYKWAGFGVSGDYGMIGFNGGSTPIDVFEVYDYPSSNLNYKTSAAFRDPNAWTHFVLRLDTTQGTSGDRIRIYVNGTQVTNFGTSTAPSQNANLGFNTSGNRFTVGSAMDTTPNPYQPYDGYIAEFIFVDGTSYAPTQFGESKNGVWKPIDPTGTSFGNNGFHLKFGNSSSLGADSSGNGNNLTASGLGTDHQVIDSPTIGTG